jgi:hypothetical protein
MALNEIKAKKRTVKKRMKSSESVQETSYLF